MRTDLIASIPNLRRNVQKMCALTIKNILNSTKRKQVLEFSDNAFQRNTRLASSGEDQNFYSTANSKRGLSIHTKGINTCLKIMPSRMV